MAEKYNIGDKVKIYRGDKKITTTITGSYVLRGQRRTSRKYYTLKVTGDNKGYPVDRLEKA